MFLKCSVVLVLTIVTGGEQYVHVHKVCYLARYFRHSFSLGYSFKLAVWFSTYTRLRQKIRQPVPRVCSFQWFGVRKSVGIKWMEDISSRRCSGSTVCTTPGHVVQTGGTVQPSPVKLPLKTTSCNPLDHRLFLRYINTRFSASGFCHYSTSGCELKFFRIQFDNQKGT